MRGKLGWFAPSRVVWFRVAIGDTCATNATPRVRNAGQIGHARSTGSASQLVDRQRVDRKLSGGRISCRRAVLAPSRSSCASLTVRLRAVDRSVSVDDRARRAAPRRRAQQADLSLSPFVTFLPTGGASPLAGLGVDDGGKRRARVAGERARVIREHRMSTRLTRPTIRPWGADADAILFLGGRGARVADARSRHTSSPGIGTAGVDSFGQNVIAQQLELRRRALGPGGGRARSLWRIALAHVPVRAADGALRARADERAALRHLVALWRSGSRGAAVCPVRAGGASRCR